MSRALLPVKNRRLWFFWHVLLVLLCSRLSCAAEPDKSALLIGIGTYDHAPTEVKASAGTPRRGRFEPTVIFHDLKGPQHDVDAMRALLTSEKFAFPDDDKHIHILRDQAATHDAILKAMQRYLVADPKPGDTVVLYISSHGSLRADPKSQGPLFDLNGTPSAAENTVVPYDWYLGSDDIFSRDLRHIFNQAADRGIHVTAIFDSCHSGSLARGVSNKGLVSRDFVFDPRPMPENPYPAEVDAIPPELRADNPVLVLSAAQKDQSAVDVQDDTPPHGLFTNALIETLQALPANRPAGDVFKRLEIAMETTREAAAQQPEMDTSAERKAQPLFGGAAGTGPPTAAVVEAGAQGLILDIGLVSDVGPGSEFTAITDVNGVRPVLKVIDSLGLSRSTATVISPQGATVHAKDIVQLSKWVPAPRPVLNFYAGAANPSQAQIKDALSVVRASGIKLVADPSSDPWTHHLAWDGAHWILDPHPMKTSAGPDPGVKRAVLGSRLSGGAFGKLPPTSILWFDVPLPKESMPNLLGPPAAGEPARTAQLTNDRDQAKYVIAGMPTDGNIRYAWFSRSDLDWGVQTPKDIGAGCSPRSPYPLRTDWITADASASPESPLTEAAMQLARLNGWLQLDSFSLFGKSDFPYRLRLRNAAQNEDIEDKGTTHKGDYELWLVGNAKAKISPRWVYVLEIDCQGRGSLLWPHAGAPAAKFPTEGGQLDRIPLPKGTIAVDDPLGTDTYLLLTTATELVEPTALEFTGVVTRGAPAGPKDPLEELLDATSAGSRGPAKPTPTHWSVQTLQTQSVSDQ